MKRIIGVALIVLLALAVPASAFLMRAGGTTASAPVQTIASLTMSCGSACNFTTGSSGQTIGTATATMSPALPTFSAGGGIFSLVASGGPCSGGDTTDFAIGASTGVITNTSGSTAAGSYTACVKAAETGISNSPQYFAVSITG